MRRIWMAAIACLALCVAACDEDGDPVFVGQGEAGRTIVLRVGQQLVVGLSGNPTTGFAWSHQSSSDDVLRASGHEYLPAQPVLAGSGGTERFRFTAAARGHTAVRFEYRRPWENGVPPAQVVEYTVVVE